MKPSLIIEGMEIKAADIEVSKDSEKLAVKVRYTNREAEEAMPIHGRLRDLFVSRSIVLAELKREEKQLWKGRAVISEFCVGIDFSSCILEMALRPIQEAPAAALPEIDIERVAIVEEDRQMIILALALTTLLRPGWYYACGNIADRFQGRDQFEEMRRLNADVVKPQANLI